MKGTRRGFVVGLRWEGGEGEGRELCLRGGMERGGLLMDGVDKSLFGLEGELEDCRGLVLK
jgi:hypothetical protein